MIYLLCVCVCAPVCMCVGFLFQFTVGCCVHFGVAASVKRNLNHTSDEVWTDCAVDRLGVKLPCVNLLERRRDGCLGTPQLRSLWRGPEDVCLGIYLEEILSTKVQLGSDRTGSLGIQPSAKDDRMVYQMLRKTTISVAMGAPSPEQKIGRSRFVCS